MSACLVMVLESDFIIQVLKVHNKQMLVGKVLGTNAILRFRFFKCILVEVFCNGIV